MRIEFTNNQYKNGEELNPIIQLKTFNVFVNDKEFLDMYLYQLGVNRRQLKFYKYMISHLDKGRGYTNKEHFVELKKLGIAWISAKIYLSELNLMGKKHIPLVLKLNNGMWTVPKEILYNIERIGEFKNCEFKVNVIRSTK